MYLFDNLSIYYNFGLSAKFNICLAETSEQYRQPLLLWMRLKRISMSLYLAANPAALVSI